MQRQQSEEEKNNIYICISYIQPHCFSDLRHLTSTCDIVIVIKTFHSSRGNESIITNAGIIWNCVKTFGVRLTQVAVLQTLIDILKQKIKTGLLYWLLQSTALNLQ